MTKEEFNYPCRSCGITYCNKNCDKFNKWLELAEIAIGKQSPKHVHGKNGDFTIDDFKGIRDTRYKCPLCNKFVKNSDTYCNHCGQKIVIPTIKHSKYEEGKKERFMGGME